MVGFRCVVRGGRTDGWVCYTRAMPVLGLSRRRALTYLASTRLVLVSVERFAFPFLPAIARGLDVSLTQAGWLLSARGVGGLVGPSAVAGASRQRDARTLVPIGLLLFVAGALLVALPGAYVPALIGFAILGTARPIFDVAAQSYLSDRSSYSRRGRLLAVLELMYAGGLLVGAPLAGWLIATWDWRAPFLAGAALAVVSAVLVRPALEPSELKDRVVAAVSLDRETWVFLGFATLLLFAAEVTFLVFGAWLEDEHGFSIVGIGVAVIAIGVAELAGEVITLIVADRAGKRRTVLAGCGMAAVAMVALPLAGTNLLAGFAAVAVGLFAFEVAIVAAVPLASELRPDSRVRFLALFGVALSAGRILAAGVGPWIYESAGIGANGLVSAGLFALAAVGLAIYVRDRNTTGTGPTS